MLDSQAIRSGPIALPTASIASMMQRVMIQADRTLLERAQRVAHERGVSFPQLVRESLEHELALGTAQPKPISCAGVISTAGQARAGAYEPDTWR
jgi:hypothetical protein